MTDNGVTNTPDLVEALCIAETMVDERGRVSISIGLLNEVIREIERLRLLAETFERQYRQACMDHAGILAEIKTLRAAPPQTQEKKG